MSAGSITRNLQVLEKGAKVSVYSPNLASFLQPESVVSTPFNPQALIRYSYVNYNPTNLIDPSGHTPRY
ncbi:MAG: hypothetical protein EPO32_03630 [Anaerolineae bacterium]|nr:MAG: hypothetical protein EPO32_03630 [Anaerolineae bacterium]